MGHFLDQHQGRSVLDDLGLSDLDSPETRMRLLEEGFRRLLEGISTYSEPGAAMDEFVEEMSAVGIPESVADAFIEGHASALDKYFRSQKIETVDITKNLEIIFQDHWKRVAQYKTADTFVDAFIALVLERCPSKTEAEVEAFLDEEKWRKIDVFMSAKTKKSAESAAPKVFTEQKETCQQKIASLVDQQKEADFYTYASFEKFCRTQIRQLLSQVHKDYQKKFETFLQQELQTAHTQWLEQRKEMDTDRQKKVQTELQQQIDQIDPEDPVWFRVCQQGFDLLRVQKHLAWDAQVMKTLEDVLNPDHRKTLQKEMQKKFEAKAQKMKAFLEKTMETVRSHILETDLEAFSWASYPENRQGLQFCFRMAVEPFLERFGAAVPAPIESVIRARFQTLWGVWQREQAQAQKAVQTSPFDPKDFKTRADWMRAVKGRLVDKIFLERHEPVVEKVLENRWNQRDVPTQSAQNLNSESVQESHSSETMTSPEDTDETHNDEEALASAAPFVPEAEEETVLKRYELSEQVFQGVLSHEQFTRGLEHFDALVRRSVNVRKIMVDRTGASRMGPALIMALAWHRRPKGLIESISRMVENEDDTEILTELSLHFAKDPTGDLAYVFDRVRSAESEFRKGLSEKLSWQSDEIQQFFSAQPSVEDSRREIQQTEEKRMTAPEELLSEVVEKGPSTESEEGAPPDAILSFAERRPRPHDRIEELLFVPESAVQKEKTVDQQVIAA